MKLLKPCLASVFLALNACGGGGSNAPTTSVAAPPPPAPPPTAERMDDCQGLDFLSILSASDDGSSDTGLILKMLSMIIWTRHRVGHLKI